MVLVDVIGVVFLGMILIKIVSNRVVTPIPQNLLIISC